MALWIELLSARRAWQRAGLSAIVAAAWLAPATLWMFDLTALGWPIAVAGFCAMHGLGAAVVPADARRLVAFPAVFTLVEALRWYWPFGGVPVATMAIAQVAGPLAPTAALFGPLLVTALTVLVGGIAVALLRRQWRSAAIAAALLLVAFWMTALAPGAETGDEIAVALVQGGGPQNTRAELCQNRAVFERHFAATRTLLDEPVDLVLWPENAVHPSSDSALTPRRCSEPLLGASEAHSRLAALAVELDTVLVVGWFEPSYDGLSNLNYSAVYSPEGEIVDSYHKVQLVPFGETVPLRGLIERFSGELPPRDVLAGTGPAVLDTPIGRLGIAISWEVFFDHRARDAIGNGGAVLLNPTNGSSYWLTILQSQQIASSRLRAIETDRWVLQAAPTGFSAAVSPDGEVLERTGISEAGVISARIGLRQGTTWAVRWGAWPMLVISTAVLLAVLARRKPASKPPRNKTSRN